MCSKVEIVSLFEVQYKVVYKVHSEAFHLVFLRLLLQEDEDGLIRVSKLDVCLVKIVCSYDLSCNRALRDNRFVERI